MENTRTVAKVTVPESRWKEIFGESYESVIEQLLQIKIYKIEIFEDGTQIINFDTNFLVSYGNTNLKFYPNEWIRDQPAFSFQFDRRILNLIEFHLESAHVAAILSHGIIDRIETGPVTLY